MCYVSISTDQSVIIKNARQYQAITAWKGEFAMKDWEKMVFASEEERMAHWRSPSLLPRGFTVAALWAANAAFKEEMFRRAGFHEGNQVLLIAEDTERCGLTSVPTEAVRPAGKVHAFDVMSSGRARHQWNMFDEICRPYGDGFFDVAVATTIHHMDDLDREVGHICRVVKKGGRIVLADNGPGKAFFEAADLDTHIQVIADMIVLMAGIGFRFSDSGDEAYEKGRAFALNYDPDKVKKSLARFVRDPTSFEHKGFWLVNGTRT